MSLKSRIERLEEKTGAADPLIVFFKTFLEANDGSVETEIWRATIASGPAAGTFVDRHGDESFDEFQSRAYQISRGQNDTVPEGVSRTREPKSPTTNPRKALGSHVQRSNEAIEQKE
ncbi:MAG: hypothetical protein EP320_11075 [Rhodobacteraceae bacterium]|nr:MAG: hypothetical protein EP320_11075 [Paracoccaceae bacterium]